MTSQTETPDIVERLLMHGGKADIEDVLADCREAAAEIEGLRSELADAQQAASVEAELRREFKARAEKAEAELAKHQWRTMDSFPSDGEDYLVTDARIAGGHSQVVWCDHEVGPSDGLYVKDVSLCYPHGFFTHWMPLPPPPSPQGENDG
jgi:hypothetical protein